MLTTFNLENVSRCKIHNFNRLNFQDALRTNQSCDDELIPFYLTIQSIFKPTGIESQYGPEAVIKMRGARSVLLDLTADGDVFVPDRRLGRSRRLIDSFFPPFACVAPDQVLCFHLSPFLSLPPSFSLSFSPPSHFHPPCPPSSLPAPSHLLLAQSPASSEVRRRHFAPRRRHSCFCRGAYK